MAAFAWCALPRIEKLRYKVHLQIKERSRLIEIERTEKRLQCNNKWIVSLAPLSEVSLTHSFRISTITILNKCASQYIVLA